MLICLICLADWFEFLNFSTHTPGQVRMQGHTVLCNGLDVLTNRSGHRERWRRQVESRSSDEAALKWPLMTNFSKLKSNAGSGRTGGSDRQP